MASTPKPARNRLRRSCDVCFKSKTKCDDHRPCNSCIRRKCEDRCVISGQPDNGIQNNGLLDGVHRAATTPVDRGNGADTSGHTTISPYDSPANGSSSKTQTRPRESSLGWNQNQNSYQTWNHRRSYSLEEATARDLLGLREQANIHLRQMARENLLEHVWDDKGPHEGRTHYAWLLRKFADILPHVDDDSRQVKKQRLSPPTVANEQSRNGVHLESNGFHIQRGILDEIPSRDDCIRLIGLFFDNYAQVFPILHQNDFERSYYMATSTPDTFASDNNFVIMLLLVLLLGNTLLDAHRRLVASDIAVKWLGLAQSWQNTVMQSVTFNWEQIQIIVLLNLVRQVSKVNTASDWISTGTAARAAMTAGFHRSQSLLFSTGHMARVLWTSLVELDLQASLAAGLLPITTSNITQIDPFSKSSSTSTSEIWNGLVGIMPLRHDILMKLNSELRTKHQDAVQLARELTGSVSPLLKNGRKPGDGFAFEYLAFVYRRFMFALHRPFAIQEDPAFHFSQRICTSLSLTHIERICRIQQASPKSRTSFENLLVSYGSMFWDEAFQSVMFLSHSLLRTQSVEDEIMDTIMLGDDLNGADSHGVSTTTVRRAVEKYIPIAEKNLNGEWPAEQAFLVPAITLAYLDILKQYPDSRDAESWQKALKEAQQQLAQRCLSV